MSSKKLHDSNLIELGNRVRSLRKELGFNQKQFAEMILIDNGYLSKIERGLNRPSDLVLSSIQSVFNVSKEWLLTGKGSRRSLETFERMLQLAPLHTQEDEEEIIQILLKSRLFDVFLDMVASGQIASAGAVDKKAGGAARAIAEERLSVVYGREAGEKLLGLVEALLKDRELYVKHDDLIAPVAEVIKHTGQMAREREAGEKVRAKRKARKSSA